jgi:hypothetical protein
MIRTLQVALVSVAFVSCSIAAAAPTAAQGGKVQLAAPNTPSQPATGQAVRPDSSAVNQSTITQYGIVGSPAKSLFRRLVREFADGQFGPYSVVSSDARTGTIVVKRDAIDSDSWAKWSSCSVGPLEMLDSLQDGIATVTISLEPTKRVTDAAVAAGFEGRYGLTATSSMATVRCSSRGVLEKDLLTAITTAEATRPRRVAKR